MITNQMAANTATTNPTSAPSTPSRKTKVADPLSPAPTTEMELHACLEDFFRQKDIDIRDTEPILADIEFTPDIIVEVSVDHLVEVMGIKEGRARKFQSFCKVWVANLDQKRRRAV